MADNYLEHRHQDYLAQKQRRERERKLRQHKALEAYRRKLADERQPPEVGVVIVNYRVKYFLEQTLHAVSQALEGRSHEVWVVDNNSGDDSLEYARARYPHYHYIENTENVGFARANNQAIMRCRARYCLILNPDTIITRACIDRGLEWMSTHERCGAIGLRMIDGDGVFLPESKRAFPTPWVSFCKIFGLSALFPRSRRFARYHLRFLDDREAHRVDILSGAAMLCRTAVLQQIGGFDEDFFMYGEDIDLSYRITKAGYDNWYLPVEMIHYKGESTKKDSMRYVRVFYDAMLIFYRKHYPRYSAVFYPIVKAGVLVRASLAVLRRGVSRLLPRRAQSAEPHGDNVVLDDSAMTCDQLVDYIARHSRPGLHFHIKSARNGRIISPKMSQL